jgi:hypothetical protein
MEKPVSEAFREVFAAMKLRTALLMSTLCLLSAVMCGMQLWNWKLNRHLQVLRKTDRSGILAAEERLRACADYVRKTTSGVAVVVRSADGGKEILIYD